MPDGLLPLFPLAVVLLPHNRLPLHIFEDRYKEMIGEAIANASEFGVVLAAGRGLMPIGCTATVEATLEKYPDGRLDILTLGRRRFSIESVNQDRDYLRAEVSYFDDRDSDAPAPLRAQAVDVCRLLPDAAGDDDPDAADPQLSFLLARHVPDLDFRQQLLAMRSESERLDKLIEFVPGFLEHSRQAGHLKSVAPKNGHGKLPPGLVKGGS